MNTAMQDGGLRLEHDGGLRRILIDRAAKQNALTQAMWQALPGLVAEAEADPAARVIVIQSATPGLFCAGADIGEMRARHADAGWSVGNQADIVQAQEAVAGARLPTVAFIDGNCIGGGCVLALACDIRVASPRARFGIPPARLGIAYPIKDVVRLVELVGPGQARRLLFGAKVIDAGEALRIGLVEELSDDAEALLEAISSNSAWSIEALKGFVQRAVEGQREEDADTTRIFAEAFEGEDFRARTAAFLARKA